MNLTFFKILMVLLLCLSFIGQTVASTVMYYKMVGMMEVNDGSTSSQLTKMSIVNNHCNLMMGKTSANTILPSNTPEKPPSHMLNDELIEKISEPENASSKCCEKSCDCFAGSCSVVAMTMKCLTHKFVIGLPTKISSVCSLAKSQRLTSLYKPPIMS